MDFTKFQPFGYHTAAEVQRDLDEIGIPFREDVSPLWQEKKLAGYTAANRILFQPMEGCDGERDGSPSELTLRRYRRYARGGAGVICQITQAPPHCLHLFYYINETLLFTGQ